MPDITRSLELVSAPTTIGLTPVARLGAVCYDAGIVTQAFEPRAVPGQLECYPLQVLIESKPSHHQQGASLCILTNDYPAPIAARSLYLAPASKSFSPAKDFKTSRIVVRIVAPHARRRAPDRAPPRWHPAAVIAADARCIRSPAASAGSRPKYRSSPRGQARILPRLLPAVALGLSLVTHKRALSSALFNRLPACGRTSVRSRSCRARRRARAVPPR